MKIASGYLKGKKLKFIKSEITRPLINFVKENIFNIIQHSKLIKTTILKAKILDLYCGVGSFGIESISREAKSVTFVDIDKKAISILNNNIKDLSIEGKTKVYDQGIENFIKKGKTEEKFDIIFFDPPYKDIDYTKYLEKIKNLGIFNPNHILIIHREVSSEDYLNNLIHVKMIKKYGRSKIIFGNF